MILSVSRRTDIPAFYSRWFINRINEGFVMVRNPINPNLVSKISLSSEFIDCIVFWTKNAKPMIEYLDYIEKKYMYYFQYTLNAYDSDIEPNINNLKERIEVFKHLSSKIGKNRVIWRYDPIIITEKYTVEWHINMFKYLANNLKNHTSVCVFSFVDFYDKILKNMNKVGSKPLTRDTINLIASEFAKIAKENNITLKTCSEEIDLEKYEIEHSCCIDPKLMSQLLDCNLKTKKDPNQRPICGCIESIDIGQYNTCLHGCLYCYANYSHESVLMNFEKHDESSPLLIGHLKSTDKIVDRKMKSLKDYSITLF